ncbi:hypothetical protein TNIN_128311 [Trichonephila inaurata madagascariensis]|uniref:Uncharacterized protein n=1 Tax=Trichonephila inaurata madagascariensis TaxID=2747483 RepID=A0A8X6XH33_9ARAC|nr:hypothetical protein TNIN_128311 [Trichonephila inaurata madagascariensis]
MNTRHSIRGLFRQIDQHHKNVFRSSRRYVKSGLYSCGYDCSLHPSSYTYLDTSHFPLPQLDEKPESKFWSVTLRKKYGGGHSKAYNRLTLSLSTFPMKSHLGK